MQLTNKHTVGSCYSACEVLSKQSNKHLKPPEHKDKNTDVVSTEEQYSLLLDMHSSLFLSLSLSHTHTFPQLPVHGRGCHASNWILFFQYLISSVLLAPFLNTAPSLPVFYPQARPSLLPSLLQVPRPRPGVKPITDTRTPHMHKHT